MKVFLLEVHPLPLHCLNNVIRIKAHTNSTYLRLWVICFVLFNTKTRILKTLQVFHTCSYHRLTDKGHAQCFNHKIFYHSDCLFDNAEEMCSSQGVEKSF